MQLQLLCSLQELLNTRVENSAAGEDCLEHAGHGLAVLQRGGEVLLHVVCETVRVWDCESVRVWDSSSVLTGHICVCPGWCRHGPAQCMGCTVMGWSSECSARVTCYMCTIVCLPKVTFSHSVVYQTVMNNMGVRRSESCTTTSSHFLMK